MVRDCCKLNQESFVNIKTVLYIIANMNLWSGGEAVLILVVACPMDFVHQTLQGIKYILQR